MSREVRDSGDRLPVRLREWQSGDLGLLTRLLGDPEMTVHLGGPETPEQLQRRHERYVRSDEPGSVFAITLGGDATPAGWVGYWETPWQGRAVWEMGWNVLPEYQRRGVASAAVRLALVHAASAGLHGGVHALPAVDNAASNALCRRAGFVLLGPVDIEYPPGRPMRSNDWVFDLTRLPEWSATTDSASREALSGDGAGLRRVASREMSPEPTRGAHGVRHGGDPVSDMRAILTANNVVLGPMAGICEAPFRGICKDWGAGLTYTEMVSAKGLHYNPNAPATRSLLDPDPREVPCAVQIFGADPQLMAEAAQLILERLGEAVACIDINMGCPVSKVVNRGEGSALMRTPQLAATIVERVASTVAVPVTAKIRKGWDSEHVNAVELARRLEVAGAAAVCVHGRTRGQHYHGIADWDVIAQVKAALTVPVIGSGDVMSAADAQRMLERTGADAAMIARGAQGRPWVFAQARALIDRGESIPPPPPQQRIDIAREHARAMVERFGEQSFTRMRKHVVCYVKGLPDASALRSAVFAAPTYRAFDDALLRYRAQLGEEDGTPPEG